MRLDLGKLELCVVRIHLLDLFPGGGAQDLDDLHQLVHPAVPGEDGLPQHQLGKDAARGPDVNVGGVVRGAEYQLRGPATFVLSQKCSTASSILTVSKYELNDDKWKSSKLLNLIKFHLTCSILNKYRKRSVLL